MKKQLLFLAAASTMLLGAAPAVPAYVGNKFGNEGLSPDFVEPGSGLNKLRLMGRTLMLGFKRVNFDRNTFLPEQVDIRGRKLFTAPARLEIKAGGKNLVVDNKKLAMSGKNQVTGTFSGNAGSVKVNGKLTIEFDGTMTYDLTIIPDKKGVKLDKTALIFPLNLPDDKLISAQVEGPNKPQSGLEAERRRLRLNLKEKTIFKPGFCPLFWVGDTKGGFSISCENAHDWNCTPKNEFVFDPATGVLTVNVIESPVTLDKTLSYRFYFNITPLRQMPKDWRSWRLGTRYDNMNPTDSTHMVYWQFWRANRTECHNNLWIRKPELLKQISEFDKKAGRSILHYIHPQLQSHTIIWNENGKISVLEDPYLRELAKKVMYLPQPSAKSAFPAIPDNAVRYTDNNKRDKDVNYQWLNGKVYELSFAPVPEFQDKMVAGVKNMIDHGADGIYCDGAGPRENYRPGKDGGMPDFRGVIRPTYPIGGYRNMFKRMRALVRKNNPSAWMLAHNSGVAYAPIISLFDIRMTGENEFYWYKEEDVRDASPDGEFYYAYIWGDIDNLKADYNRAWGLPTVILPELKGRNHRPYEKITRGTRTMLSYTIQFDFLYWPLWCDAREINKFEAIRNRFGMKEDSTGTVEFTPYWENKSFKVSDPAVKIGYYERLQQIDPDFSKPEEKRFLLLVSNMQFSDAKAVITLPEYSFKLKAFDRQSNKPVAISNGKITLDIAPYDFAIIEVSGKADK